MSSLLKFSVSGIVLAAIILSQKWYEEEWFKESLRIIPDLQEGVSETSASIWKIYSDYGLVLISANPIIYSFLQVNNRPLFFYFIIVFLAANGLSQVLKLHDHEARPFWVGPDVQAFSCSNGYGNPSGHCTIVTASILAFYLSMYDSARTGQNQQISVCKRNWTLRILNGVIGLALIGTIAYSRMILGVHSLNQVVYGTLLGVWLGFTLHFAMRDAILSHIRGLLIEEGRTDADLRKNALMACGLFVGVFGVMILTYEAVEATFENPIAWKLMITEKCEAEKLEGAFESSAMEKFGFNSAAWGTYFGFLANCKYSTGAGGGQRTSEFADLSIRKKMVMVGLAFLLVAPWIALNLLIGLAKFENGYVRLLI